MGRHGEGGQRETVRRGWVINGVWTWIALNVVYSDRNYVGVDSPMGAFLKSNSTSCDYIDALPRVNRGFAMQFLCGLNGIGKYYSSLLVCASRYAIYFILFPLTCLKY